MDYFAEAIEEEAEDISAASQIFFVSALVFSCFMLIVFQDNIPDKGRVQTAAAAPAEDEAGEELAYRFALKGSIDFEEEEEPLSMEPAGVERPSFEPPLLEEPLLEEPLVSPALEQPQGRVKTRAAPRNVKRQRQTKGARSR